jgi:serine/threonine protein kinase
MRQLLTGLHYCHVNQVLHRDIKGTSHFLFCAFISILLIYFQFPTMGVFCYHMKKSLCLFISFTHSFISLNVQAQIC